jgi:hypothetical protein
MPNFKQVATIAIGTLVGAVLVNVAQRKGWI